MEAGAHLEPERAHALDDRLGTADPPRRSVERGEEPVARRVELPPAVPGKAPADDGVVLLHQIGPAPVAELGLPCSRAHDVGEEDGREDPAELRLLLPQLAHELLDRLRVGLGVLLHDRRLSAGHRPPSRTGDQRCEGAGLLLLGAAAAAQHEGRHADRAEHVTDVGVVEHPGERDHVTSRGREVHPLEIPVDHLFARHPGHGPRRVALGVGPRAPALLHLREHPLEVFPPHAPGIVRSPRDPRRGVHQDDPVGSLGVRRGEQARKRAAVRTRDEQSTLPADCVEHRPQIVHSLLERRQALVAEPVGEAHPAPVERDQATERGEALPEGLHGRRMRDGEAEDVRADVEHVDAAGSVTVDSVGDVVLPALRVLDLGCGHGRCT